MFPSGVNSHPRRPESALPALLVGLLAVGCAHTPEEPVVAERRERAVGVEDDGPEVAYRPIHRLEARDMLEAAFEASHDGDNETAVLLFGAVLATDFLTDQGRANLYWMKAEAHRELGDHASRVDALGSFLLASELVPLDDDLVLRRLLARSALAAIRVAADPGFGRSPETPITVEDVREPASIIASLSCGPSGQGRYVDVTIRSVQKHGVDGQLLQRRAECRPSGRMLELWFDLSRAQLASD